MTKLIKIIKDIVFLNKILYLQLVVIDILLFVTILACSVIVFKYIIMTTGTIFHIHQYEIKPVDLVVLFTISITVFFISNFFHLSLTTQFIKEYKNKIKNIFTALQIKMIIAIAVSLPIIFGVFLLLIFLSVSLFVYVLFILILIFLTYKNLKVQLILEKYFLKNAILPIFSIGKKNDIYYYLFYISTIFFLLLQLHLGYISTSISIIIFFIIKYLSSKLKEVLSVLSFNKLLEKKTHQTFITKGSICISQKKSDTLILLFPPFDHKKFSKNLLISQGFDRHHTITITDGSQMKTLNGLNNEFPNFSSIISFLTEYKNVNKIKKIVTFGCSGGGHSALLYGSLLKADLSIALNPFPYLSIEEIIKQKDERSLKVFLGLINKFNKLPNNIKKYFDLRDYIKSNQNKVEIHISNNSWDTLRAKYLEDLKNVKVITHKYNKHGGLLKYFESLNNN